MSVWKALSKIPFHRLDEVMDQGRHHRMLDKSIGWLRGKPPFLPFGFYSQGWGDPAIPVKFRTWIGIYADLVRSSDDYPVRVNVEPTASSIHQRYAHLPEADLQEYTFDTCVDKDLCDSLPVESRQSHFLLVRPKNVTSGSPLPMTLLLAGTGEHGYLRRLESVALPLASKGIGSLILESPYYGKRRPPRQIGSKLRRVSDLPVLGRVTIEEACSLIRWMEHERGYGPIVAGGTSMGGLHAAMTASLLPSPVGVVSWLGPPSAAPVFSDGLMSNFCEWARLEQEVNELKKRDAVVPGANKRFREFCDARDYMREFLSLTDLDNFPQPVAPEFACFTVAKHDEYIPAQCTNHWERLTSTKWAGATFREISGGHVSGILFKSNEICTAFEEVVDKMLSANEQGKQVEGRNKQVVA